MIANQQRNAEMLRRRATGETLQEIADAYGLTRERVRQITDPDGLLSAARRTAQREFLADAVAEHVAATERAIDARDPVAADMVRAVPRRARTDKIRAFMYLQRSRAAAVNNNPRRYTDEDLVESMRAAHKALDDPAKALTHLAYDTHRPRGTAGSATVVARFGTWSQACAAAGLPTPTPRRRDYVRKWGEDDFIEWVARFFDAHPAGGGYAVVEAWLRDTPGAPSAALIRVRLRRPWTEIVELAMERRAAR